MPTAGVRGHLDEAPPGGNQGDNRARACTSWECHGLRPGATAASAPFSVLTEPTAGYSRQPLAETVTMPVTSSRGIGADA